MHLHWTISESRGPKYQLYIYSFTNIDILIKLFVPNEFSSEVTVNYTTDQKFWFGNSILLQFKITVFYYII